MPLYEYQCDACGHRFELIKKYSDPPLKICPKCGGAVHKLQSAPAFQFKGTGWYVTDYGKKDQGAETKEDSSSKGASETKDASAKSESDKSDKTGKIEKSAKSEKAEKSEKSEKREKREKDSASSKTSSPTSSAKDES
jgi:putative FmdB family regulatory protein